MFLRLPLPARHAGAPRAPHARTRSFSMLAVLALSALACSGNPDRVRSILEADGYTHIQVGGASIGSCADGDTWSNEFEGNKGEQRITGALCGGWLKGTTTRVLRTRPLRPGDPGVVPQDEFTRRADSLIASRAERARQVLIDSLCAAAR